MIKSLAFLGVATAVMLIAPGTTSPSHAASMPAATAQCLAPNAGVVHDVRCRRICRWRCWGPWWDRRCGNRCFRRCW